MQRLLVALAGLVVTTRLAAIAIPDEPVLTPVPFVSPAVSPTATPTGAHGTAPLAPLPSQAATSTPNAAEPGEGPSPSFVVPSPSQPAMPTGEPPIPSATPADSVGPSPSPGICLWVPALRVCLDL